MIQSAKFSATKAFSIRVEKFALILIIMELTFEFWQSLCPDVKSVSIFFPH